MPLTKKVLSGTASKQNHRLSSRRAFPLTSQARGSSTKPNKSSDLYFNIASQVSSPVGSEVPTPAGLMSPASPLKDKFRLRSRERRSMFPREFILAKAVLKEKLGFTTNFNFTRISDCLPRLPKHSYAFEHRSLDETECLSDEPISKEKFKEFVQVSCRHIKRLRIPTKPTTRELNELNTFRRKRVELNAMLQEANKSKEIKFAEVIDQVKRDYGMEGAEEVELHKFNEFEHCV